MLNTVPDSKYDAIETGLSYFSAAYDLIHHSCCNASEGDKAQAASTLALSMAISELATAASGAVGGSPVTALIEKIMEDRR